MGVFRKMLHILHVDDDAVEAMNLQRIFRKLDVQHQLHTASNGEEALRRLRDPFAIRPDLILLDLHMPLMDGIEFLQALRADESLRSMAVYVLTSSNLPQDCERANGYGIRTYLVKPVTPAKYNEVIGDLLQVWESTDFQA